jgi:hypothetical protein
MKKIALIGLCFLSVSAFADVVSSTHVDSMNYVETGVPTGIYTGHNYIIDNQSGSTQTVQVCFDVTACPEYSSYTKNLHECINETVQNGQTITRNKTEVLTVNYPWVGYCNLVAKTDMTGWTHHSSSAQGKIKVSPNSKK